ncbi:MAG TPA: gephyrin-like molybdotransferase Glp [Aquabacterium sp.]|uniref:molybdopterin molybdotransferase MoeA n=1 Tax=Aquabacterium sp. TaxID=1872578 RepID=UPI002E30FDAA|nr:gephyrin-like molybdotransferase Glp [Aquabacterium sp.]HEX5355110.1 gephyrin-like molybdotransferase Glp [Aquabacterium sp.]
MATAFKPLMPLDEAWSALRAAVENHVAGSQGQRQTESISSFEALGRVLAETVVSPVDVPPLDNSAMDGYAVRAADLVQAGQVGAAPEAVTLPQAQRIAAGQVGVALQAGQCARIFTGAPVPAGADAVVMQEHTTADPGAGTVRFNEPVKAGQNIRRRGEDIAQGQAVLQAGLRLSAAGLGVAASVGKAALTVFKQPRVGILTTGSELVMPGQPLPAGAIYNSNRHTLRGLVQAAGGQAQDLGIVPDQLDATRAALREAAQHNDLVISSGGVSVGEEDHLRNAVLAEGGLDFWALAIKPGKPFVFGWLQRADGSRALYMGLPGNPVASYVTFLLLVRPVLAVLAGEAWALPQSLQLQADFTWPKADKRREFARARLGADGRVTLYPNQGSGVLTSAVWADGLLDLLPGQTVQPGDTVSYLPLAELLQPASGARLA